MSTFDRVANTEPLAIWPGALARAINGERVTMAVIDLEPDLDIQEHHHENEQVGMVLAGSITMFIGAESRELTVGETYVIPSDLPHSARTGEAGATVLDVFAPVRADWSKAKRLAPSPGRWP